MNFFSKISRWLLLSAGLLFMMVKSFGQITGAEYFIDADPGVGNGTTVPVTNTPGDTASFSLSLPMPAGLPTGFRSLHVRAKSGGQWGHFASQWFYSTGAFTTNSQIVSAEYFFDEDPGLGNASTVNIGTGNALTENVNIPIPGSLSNGIHTLNLRAKNNNGFWGHSVSQIFFVSGNASALGHVSSIEYFYDVDPGQGNGTILSITPNDTISQVFSIPAAGLSPGFHTLYVRAKNDDNIWGHTQSRMLIVTAGQGADKKIVAAEYFIDNDPGVGNGNAIAINPPVDTYINSHTVVLPGNLSDGGHTFVMRVLDEEGTWSHFEIKEFVVKHPKPGSGHALSFDGVNDNVNIPVVPLGAAYTVEAWVKPEAANGNKSIFSFSAGDPFTSNSHQIRINGSGKVEHYTYDGTGKTITGSSTLEMGKWYHVAATAANNGEMRLFINGVQEGAPVPIGNLWNVMNTMHIANSTAGGWGYFNGVVDEVRVWNAELSEVAIRDRMCRKVKAGDQSYNSLVYHFDFDEATGFSAFDIERNQSGNINNGAEWKISGAPIGDSSAHSYSGPLASANLRHPLRNDELTASLNNGTAAGVQIYVVTDTANTISGTTCMDVNEGYFGVFPIGGSNVTYDIDYDYTPFVGGGISEVGFKLYNREDNSGQTWANTNATVDTNLNLLEANIAQRGEYIVSSSIVAPSIVISSDKGSSICLGENVTFSAVMTNEGAAPQFEWKKNGISVGTGSTYTDSTLTNGDEINCKLTSNSSCVSPDAAVSNLITMSVGNLPASVLITAVPSGIVCAGTQINFTAVASNGGSVPVYQWKVNGSIVGGNAPVLTLSNLVQNDVVTVEMQTSESCAFPAMALSNPINMDIIPLVQPAISIVSSEGDQICFGTPVVFTATATHGGNAHFQWLKNGSPVGVNSNIYTDNNLNHNDVITCQLTSDLACATPASVLATSITMQVSSSAPTSISISANGSTTICQGANLSFTASITNGGSSPIYQWKKNGVDVGTNSSTFSDNTFLDGDILSCELVSSSSCAAVNTASSNNVTVTILQYQTPSVIIQASGADTICAGTTIQFSSIITPTGYSGSYQWKKNGINISGANGASYSTTNLTTEDTITCTLISSYPCLNGNSITSNALYKVVHPRPLADAGTNQTILQGSSTVLTANGGTRYLWSNADTAAAIIVSPNSTTTYTLTAYNEFGCSSTDEVTVIVDFSNLSISPSSYNFGNIVIDDTATNNITLTNTGTLPISINGVSLSGVFSTTFTTASLNPSQSVQIPVNFVPVSALIYQAPLQIQTSVGNYVVMLGGKGVLPAPVWTVASTSFTYPNTAVSDSSMHVFSISNTGNVPIVVDNIVSDNSAFEIYIAPQTIPTNASGLLYIKFKPTAVSSYSGSVTISAQNLGLSPITLTLNGNGYVPGLKPVLEWNPAFPYNASSGVDMPVAAARVFNYSVVYKHPAGIAPAPGFPRVGIDFNADQDFVDVGEGVFTMIKVGAGTDWINGETYVFSAALGLGAGYGYGFFAKDANGNDAALHQVNYVSAPLVTNQALDLRIYADDITFSDNNPNVSQVFDVFAKVHNNSPYSASDVPIRFYNDSVFLLADTIPFIPANTTVTISRSLSFNTDGFYPIKIWIDSAQTLTENNVLNNYAIRPVIVGQFSLPGAIQTTAHAIANSCNVPSVSISGVATYDGLNLQGNPPVLGATVTVQIIGGPTLTTHTVTGGNWTVNWAYFACGQTYDYTVEITDYTLTSVLQSGSFNAPCVVCTPPTTPTASLTHQSSIGYCVALNTPTSYTVNIATNCVSPAYFNDTTFIYINGVLSVTHTVDTIYACVPVALASTFTFGLGTHVIDYTSVFYDSVGNRNVVQGSNTINVGEAPDLSLGGFTKAGATSFNFRDYNNSYCVGAGAHKVYLYDSTATSGQYVILDSFHVNYIAPTSNNAQPWVDLSYSNPTLEMGYHYLRFVTDKHNSVEESNESNNEMNVVFYVPFPELSIDEIELSNSNLNPGSQVNFSAKMHNTGSGAGEFRVQFYANNTPVGLPVYVDTMVANTTTTILSGVYVMPVDSCPILITAKVDIWDEIVELNENNNKDSTFIAYDLTSGVACFGYGSICNPYVVTRDSALYFHSIVSNGGTRDVHKLVDVTFKVGAQSIGYDNITGGIPSGQSKPVRVFHSFNAVGTYAITVHPDSANQHCELSESNNVGTIHVLVVEGRPDLEILSQHISPSNLNPQPGQSVSIVASVFNKGNQASVPTRVRFWVDDAPLGTDIDLESLGAGRDTTVAATMSYSSNTVGPKIIKVMADAPNLVVELREDNNTATRAIIVGAAPDIAASINEAITLSTPWARRDDTITIYNYLRNYGGEMGSGWLKFSVMDNNSQTSVLDSVAFTLAANDSIKIPLNWKVNFVGQGKIKTEIVHVSPQEYNIHNNINELAFEAGPRLKILSYDVLDSILCEDMPLQLGATISADGQMLNYDWKQNGQSISGIAVPEILIANASLTDSGKYTLTISDVFGSKTTDTIRIVVNKPISITQQPLASLDICEGNLIELKIVGENVGMYQWEQDNIAIVAADSEVYLHNSASMADGGSYRVLLSALPGCTDLYSDLTAVNISSINIDLADSGTTDQHYQRALTAYHYTDNDCKRLATVFSNSGDLGNTVVTTNVDETLEGYVPRYIDIHPENNIPAEIRLYFTQQEFDDYNVWAVINNKPLLPTVPSDPNKKNIIVLQYHGLPNSGTTGPGGHYNVNDKDSIENNEINVQWDATSNYWVLNFEVGEFSGFFVSGSNPKALNIKLLNIEAENVGAENRIYWSTASEEKGDYFELQNSEDGRTFKTIARISAGEKASAYDYIDENPFAGKNFYRLKMYNASENFDYSKVVVVNRRGAANIELQAFPNPVRDKLTIEISGTVSQGAELLLVDVNGKVLHTVMPKGNTAILDMSRFASGTYLIKLSDEERTASIKVTKE